MPTRDGSCHCGRVRVRVTAPLDKVVTCNCTICTKKGFLHLIVPRAQFQLVSGAADLAVYTFNTGIAKHQFCRHCSIHPFYVPRSDPDKIDVNVRCLDDVDPNQIDVAPFDGRNWEAAMGGHVPWRGADPTASAFVLVAILGVRPAAVDQPARGDREQHRQRGKQGHHNPYLDG
jgi:hypothetical protein